jgi:tetratricopeptide (TPR) repeat protein
MISVAVAQSAEPERLQRPRDEQRDRQVDHIVVKQQPAPAPTVVVRPGIYAGWRYPSYGYVPGGNLWVGPGYVSFYAPLALPWGLPPLYAPAGSLFGPEAAQRFLGVNRSTVPSPDADAGQAREGPPSRRATNADAVALGRRFLYLGDEHFRDGRYAMALDRYRSAAQAAPRVADAYFRQGFALAALGRYELAVKQFKHGLELQPDWARSEFRLADLYGDRETAKKGHLEAMAKAVDAKGESSDLLFLIGLALYFDGKGDRARPFFQRAEQLAGGFAAHIEPFVTPREADDE